MLIFIKRYYHNTISINKCHLDIISKFQLQNPISALQNFNF